MAREIFMAFMGWKKPGGHAENGLKIDLSGGRKSLIIFRNRAHSEQFFDHTTVA